MTGTYPNFDFETRCGKLVTVLREAIPTLRDEVTLTGQLSMMEQLVVTELPGMADSPERRRFMEARLAPDMRAFRDATSEDEWRRGPRYEAAWTELAEAAAELASAIDRYRVAAVGAWHLYQYDLVHHVTAKALVDHLRVGVKALAGMPGGLPDGFLLAGEYMVDQVVPQLSLSRERIVYANARLDYDTARREAAPGVQAAVDAVVAAAGMLAEVVEKAVPEGPVEGP